MPDLSSPDPHRGRALAIATCLLLSVLGQARATGPDWQPSPAAAFDQARRDGRLVLVDVRADWCAACRKMDETGFRDPRVLDTLSEHYVAVQGDIDRDPEISRRYGDSGVPALVILAPDGTEIIHRAGYLEPDWLYWLLLAVAQDPNPESHR